MPEDTRRRVMVLARSGTLKQVEHERRMHLRALQGWLVDNRIDFDAMYGPVLEAARRRSRARD